MTLAIVQHGHNSGNGGTPKVTLGSAPTVGNLLIAFFNVNTGNASATIGGSWTQFEITSPGLMYGLYRYVQVGDLAALPVFATAGFSFWSAEVYEISGVSGTFATDVAQHESAAPAGTTSMTTTAMTTAANGETGLIGFANYDDSGATATISAGWTLDESTMDATNYGAFGCASRSFPSSGSSVQATITFAHSFFPGYVALRLRPSAATETGTAALHFSGISLVAAGTTKPPHTGPAVLHFAGLSIVAVGSDITGPAPPTPPPGTTKKLSVDPLTWNTPIVNPDGTPKPEFQQKWNKQNSVNSAVVSQDYIDTQDAANTAANQKYTQDYGATVLAAAKAYSDSLAVTSGDNVVTMMAAANLNGNFFVKADASGNAAVPDLAVLADGIAVVGITQGAIASGSTGPVQTAGIMSDPSWSWTPGGAIYVGAAGLPTQSVPSGKWVLQGGVAVGATAIDISLRYVISTPL